MNFDAAVDADVPNENSGTLSLTVPGLACSQQAHLFRAGSLRVIHAEHSHLADCEATMLLKLESDNLFGTDDDEDTNDGAAAGTDTDGFPPGFSVLHATHFDTSFLFLTKHAEHSHVSALGLNLSPNEFLSGSAGLTVSGPETILLTGAASNVTLAGSAAFLLFEHDTHLSTVFSFRTIQTEHSHLSLVILN